MYEVLIFENRKGESTVKERLEELKGKSSNDKSARIALNKILEYIAVLERCGTRAGEKFTKHIEGDIWVLRPLPERIFFFGWVENKIVLLHCFRKKTQKTPKKEIERAKYNMDIFLEQKGGKRK
jgi:phage-related protein